MTYFRPKHTLSRHDMLMLFGYAASAFAIFGGAQTMQYVSDSISRSALQKVVGTHNLETNKPGLNQEFIDAALSKIVPTITAAKLPSFDNRKLFVEEAYTFEVAGLNGTGPTVPFAMTSAVSNPGNLYYAVPEGKRTIVVQCNTHQWLRVQTSGFVLSHQPANVAEILNSCYPTGARDNPWKDMRARATMYDTPADVRDDVAWAMMPFLRSGTFPKTEARMQLNLSGYGEASALTGKTVQGPRNLQLFYNGKLLTCDATAASVASIYLPSRKSYEDKYDGFHARDLATLTMCD